MKATIVLRAVETPRVGMVVVRKNVAITLSENDFQIAKAADTFLVYAAISRAKVQHGGTQFFTEFYLVLYKNDIQYVLDNNLQYKEVEGSLFVNPFVAVWGTSGTDSEIFKISIPTSTKPDSLSESIKTKEQGDDFMKRLNDLTNPVQRLPIELKQLHADYWIAIYENCISNGETANEAESNLYDLIDKAYKNTEAERLKLHLELDALKKSNDVTS